MQHLKHLNRRAALQQSIRYLGGSALGLGFFDWLLQFGRGSGVMDSILAHLASNNLRGAAFAADAKAPFTLIQFVLIDKVQASLFQVVQGAQPLGSDGQDGAAQKASTFRSMGLTKLFGDGLLTLPETTALVMLNAWESGNAGHSLQTSVLNDKYGGLNNAYEKLAGSTGLLGPVGFSVASSALNSSDVFLGAGGKKMQVFTTVNQLASTLKNSVNPLLAKEENRALMKDFDRLMVKDTSFRDSLTELANNVKGAVPKLEEAAKNTDPVDQQVQAIVALAKIGVCKNFMIGVPYNDTNTGGNLTTKGGGQNLDPFSVTPRIAKALSDLHGAIPDLICVSTSDGGRSQDNGDRSAGLAFLTGPTRVIKNGIIGPRFTDTTQLGTNFGDVALSTGGKAVANPKHWYSTALKAMGFDGEVDYVPDALQKS